MATHLDSAVTDERSSSRHIPFQFDLPPVHVKRRTGYTHLGSDGRDCSKHTKRGMQGTVQPSPVAELTNRVLCVVRESRRRHADRGRRASERVQTEVEAS